MKLILDFQNDDTIKITTDDDPTTSYSIVKSDACCKYSLWFNEEFVWEWEFASTAGAVASVVGSIVEAMRVK